MAKSPRFIDDDEVDGSFPAWLEDAAAFEARTREDVPELARQAFDVVFASNDDKKLVALARTLTAIGYRMQAPAPVDGVRSVRGTSLPLPVAEHTIVCWCIDLYLQAAEHDCKLAAYTRAGDFEAADRSRSAKQLFEQALAAFERNDRGFAVAYFTEALASEPANPNTLYSRACVLDMLDLAELARADYDRALELAPNFVAALVNRGANKDLADDFAGAIEDYDRAIAINDKNEAAFLNRGNSKFNQGDTGGAIADWKIAAGLGSATAKKRLAQHG